MDGRGAIGRGRTSELGRVRGKDGEMEREREREEGKDDEGAASRTMQSAFVCHGQ